MEASLPPAWQAAPSAAGDAAALVPHSDTCAATPAATLVSFASVD